MDMSGDNGSCVFNALAACRREPMSRDARQCETLAGHQSPHNPGLSVQRPGAVSNSQAPRCEEPATCLLVLHHTWRVTCYTGISQAAGFVPYILHQAICTKRLSAEPIATTSFDHGEFSQAQPHIASSCLLCVPRMTRTGGTFSLCRLPSVTCLVKLSLLEPQKHLSSLSA